MDTQSQPLIHSIYEPTSGTWQYIVADPKTSKAAIIDPVLDFDAAKNEVATKSADELLAAIEQKGYEVEALLETHLHADHVSAATYLQEQLSKKQTTVPRKCIGKGIERMQHLFASKYGMRGIS
jgi:glyoxylase-like metal-dependent hydrolase (beta-lactamase superfamily II)